ncbi:hypothetical protein NQ318_009237 [Aromia moschata]|uniref:Transposable element Tc3 transposase n=1 Tax=Aromia moschata TaxID=1265417 RepID=A0AAV8YAX6_9CUCU|nr:hypothetical protein NQ318_009237 [Aromia moschata]
MPLSMVMVVLVTGVCVMWRHVVPHCGQRQLAETVYVRTGESAKPPFRASAQNALRWLFGVSEMQENVFRWLIGVDLGASWSEGLSASEGRMFVFRDIHGWSSISWIDGRFLERQEENKIHPIEKCILRALEMFFQAMTILVNCLNVFLICTGKLDINSKQWTWKWCLQSKTEENVEVLVDVYTYLGSMIRALLIKSIAALETSSKCSGSKDNEHFDIFRKVCCLSSAPKGLNPDRITYANTPTDHMSVERPIDKLDELPLSYRTRMFFQQDGCAAHHAVTIRNWLNSEFNEHWIGRDGPILWPPRSPDLTILDFYLWGRLKQIVYREPLENDEEQLKTRIQNAVKSLSIEEIRNSFNEFRTRIEICAEKGGALFE